MVSVLRQLQTEWNSLVPEAQARGIRRVRLLNGPLETIEYRRTRLEWLRAQLGTTLLTPGGDVGPLGTIDQFTFGVEAEVMMRVGMTRSQLAAKIAAEAGVICEEEGYGHSNRPNRWKVVTDGSLGDYTRGCEVVGPPLQGAAGFETLRKVFKAIEGAGCKVSKKCGLHVHVGVRGQSVQFFKNLAVLYASAEVAIDSFMAPSRRGSMGGNGFCRSVQMNRTRLVAATTIDEVTLALGQSVGAGSARNERRYRKLNYQSYWQHGTVEFRHHQGTVEAHKAENWVRLCLRMCVTARGTEKTARTLDELMTAVEAADGEREFFYDRARRFNPGVAIPTRAQVPAPAPDRAEQDVADQADTFRAYGDFAQTPPARR